MEERNFFNEDGVSVTNARFIVNNQTYAMSGVTSVKSFKEEPSRTAPMVLIVVGILLALGSFGGGSSGGVIISLLLIGGAIWWWISQKPLYSVLLNSSSGESKALSSKDGEFISKVVSALNDSIIHRG